ncbi:MAG: peptidoglycan-binding protein [Cocleimonas sp.]|nr:peptidoglycan-binding protein [Cocleimonas sp.]
MTTLSRTAFLTKMARKSIRLSVVNNDSRLNKLNFNQIDSNHDGVIDTLDEMDALFRAIDYFDQNGCYHVITLGSHSQPTFVGKLVSILDELSDPLDRPSKKTLKHAPVPAVLSPSSQPPVDAEQAALAKRSERIVAAFRDLSKDNELSDAAFRYAFPHYFEHDISFGEQGEQVLAIQYALGRLGHLSAVCDHHFGEQTKAAVTSFQSANPPLAITGDIDEVTLLALDKAVSCLDLRPPVIKSVHDALSFLSNFESLSLPKIVINPPHTIASWDSLEIQTAYGLFISHYWEILKENRIQADCKALSLFFMDQFRAQLAEDTSFRLPLPHSPNGTIKKRQWLVTHKTSNSLLKRVAALSLKNNEQENLSLSHQATLKKIQQLDPDYEHLYGVNLKYPRTSIQNISSVTQLIEVETTKTASLTLDRLKVGHMIFIDFTGEGHYEQIVQVVKIKKDTHQRIRQLTLAVGSCQTNRDPLATTAANSLGIAHHYIEEVTVDLDIHHDIIRSEVTYSSDPSYITASRYTAKQLLRISHGGKIKIARWSS